MPYGKQDVFQYQVFFYSNEPRLHSRPPVPSGRLAKFKRITGWRTKPALLYLEGIAHRFLRALPVSSEGKGNARGFSLVLPQGAICVYPGFHIEVSVFTCCDLKRRDTVPETKRRPWRGAVQREQLRLEADLKPISLPNTVFPGYERRITVAGAQRVTSERVS